MIFTKHLFLLLIILVTGSIDALAGEVYKTVDENGNVVFSDKKTQDAKTIDVRPNVVDLDIPEMPEESVQNKSKQPASDNRNAAQPEMSGWNTTTNGSNLRRRVRTETNGQAVNRNKQSTAPAGRAGGR